ncbi:MAG: hypothetical protein JW866_09210 [Ignavibacteriales bacterium]|nr:hypothetical protein [Ignavibacteriales bacterium]
MPRLFESTKTFIKSLAEIDYLITRAEEEANIGNENYRRLFLKLVVVTLVSKVQVFTEKSMEEYLYRLKQNRKRLSSLSPHLRCVSAKRTTIKNKIEKKLEKKQNVTALYITELHRDIKEIMDHFDNRKKVFNHFDIAIKFPLGKTGSGELVDLLEQIEGKNIFNGKIDLSKLDSLLSIRHNVIHQDVNPGMTELQIKQYVYYTKKLAYYINNYLYRNAILNDRLTTVST